MVNEEIRRNTKDGISSKGEDEEKIALVVKENNGKGKKSQSKLESSQGGNKKYLSKIKCFHCNEFKHYTMKCTHNKISKNTSRGEKGEALASYFELDFTLIACMASTVMGSMWYLDLGALFHITGNRDFFSDLEDKYLHMHIEMGDKGR